MAKVDMLSVCESVCVWILPFLVNSHNISILACHIGIESGRNMYIGYYIGYIGSSSEDYALTFYKWNECFAWICAQAKCHAISCLSWLLDQSRVIDCHISGAPGCVGPKGCQALGIDPLIRLVDRRVKMNLHLYETASNSSTIINANGTC